MDRREFIRVSISALGGLACLTLPSAAQTQSGLGRTFSRLTSGKSLTIGYFGGSITEGAGASNPSKTWCALTTDWFRKQFPNAQVAEVNAAIGGTGSQLGAYRCQRDLLCKHPDLVFIEFAVNDAGQPQPTVMRSMEGVVRRIWKNNPEAEIVFVYTITKSMSASYDAGKTPDTIFWHEQVADYYGIPTVNVGRELWEFISSGRAEWASLTRDMVHPNDLGYSLYAGTVRRFLERHQNDHPAAVARALPKSMTESPLDGARMVDSWTVDVNGWEKKNESMAGRFPHMLVCGTPGTDLEFAFSGRGVGLYWLIAHDSGDIEWSVDGSAPVRCSSWDSYALSFNRAGSVVLCDNLRSGKHVLHIRVLGEKQPQSTGTQIRIGAFLVDGG